MVRDLDHLAGLDMIRLFAGLDENRCAEIKNSRRLRAESSRRPPRHRRDAARWRGGAGPTHELIFAQPGVLPLPPRAISSAFTSATMRAMAASSAAFPILAARVLAMRSAPVCLRVRCARVRADARAAFFAFFDAAARSAPAPAKQSLPRAQSNLAETEPDPADNPRITSASCLEGSTLSTYICLMPRPRPGCYLIILQSNSISRENTRKPTGEDNKQVA